MAEETISPESSTQGSEQITETKEAPTSYMEGRFDSISAMEQGITTSEKRYEDYRSMNDKRFGTFVGSPDAYELNEGLDVSDNFKAYAKENQFSNDALNGLVEFHNTEQQARNDAHYAEQRELLGKDVDSRLTNVQDWAKANLGDEAMDSVRNMITTAKGVEIFEKMMKMNTGTAPAQVPQANTSIDKETLHNMRFAKDENGYRKMSTSADYRARVEAMEAEMVSKGGKL